MQRPENDGRRPLDGIRVIDLADERGELCGRLLADLGADVIRVEPPGGAHSRSLPPFHRSRSLYFAYRNANKRGIVLDLGDPRDRARLDALLGRADVLIEAGTPALDPGELAGRFRHLVVTSITDFGRTGPYADWVATDPVLEAMGGMMFKAGVPQKPPLFPPAPLAWDVSAVSAVFATLAALLQRQETGVGQHVDLSCLEAIAQTTDWSFCNASILREQGHTPMEVRMGSGPVYTIYACKGGYVRLVILSPRQWRAMWEWLGRPEAFADPYWETFPARLANADVLTKLFEGHFASMSMEEVSAEAQRRGIVCTPVLRPEEVLANEHLASRGSFARLEVAPGMTGPVASGFIELDGERQGFRSRAPEIGEHDAEVFGELDSLSVRVAPGQVPAPTPPFAGLRVLDFGIGGVGVEAGRLFAEYGADVIKIESRTYPDFMRTVTGGEMSPSFASSSRSKRSFGVNAKHPEGLAALHRLIREADVVIENSSTGTMDELGVGWQRIRELNPRAVLVSSQLLGSRGAWADWIGYGPSTQPMGGLVHLWNYDDQDFPAGSGSIFPDHLAGRLVAVAALAALLRRDRTGLGGHGEVAQIEAVTGMLGDLLLEAGLAPGSVRPRGNRSDRGAPWGAYPCAGEQQWCVINVRDDDDWRRLREALGDPEWARAASLRTAEGRLAAQDELDARLSEWTAQRPKGEVAALLQAQRVPCGPMLTGTDQLDDPHFQAHGYPRFVEQQDLGRMAFEGPCFRASGMADVRIAQAPRLGEHTREIARELLGLEDGEIDRLMEAGALEGPPAGC